MSLTRFDSKKLFLVLIMLMVVLISGCEYEAQSLAQAPESLGEAPDTGPGVWIEYPPDGEILPMETVSLIIYAASTEGVSGLTVSINGAVQPPVQLESLSGDGSNRLVRTELIWQPPAEGEYLVEAHAGGAPASIKFCVVTCQAGSGTPSPDGEATATDTPTPELTGTSTLTTTASPYPEAEVDFWADPPSIPAGDCTNLTWHTENVKSVHLDGQQVDPNEGMLECPCETTTYNLTVVDLYDVSTDYYAEVEVIGSCEADVTDTVQPPSKPTATDTVPPPQGPTDTSPPPADTTGPTINYVTHVWEGCTIFGEASISDPSGVIWAEFWYNQDEEGWGWIEMLQDGDRWTSKVGLDTGGFAGSLQYKVRTLDSLHNETWSGVTTHNYSYCGE